MQVKYMDELPISSDKLSASIANPSRLAALVNTGLLDSPIEEAFDRLTSLAARTIGAPICLVSLVDQERQFFKSAFGLPEPWASQRETPLTHSFCKHVVATGDPLIICDANVHPLVKHNLAVSKLNVISYAGMPLTLKNGECIGSFCVIDHQPRQWGKFEIELLFDISKSVMAEIELRLLISAKEELLDVIFHDIKNLLSTIVLNSYLLRKRCETLSDLKFSKSVNTVCNASQRIRSIIQDISDLKDFERRKLVLEWADHDVDTIVNQVSRKIEIIASHKEIKINFIREKEGKIRCDLKHLTQALANLIIVAIKRSSPGENLDVSIGKVNGDFRVRIKDSAQPLSAYDVIHFFDRFVKISALPTLGDKLSICLAYEIINVLHGTLSVEAGEKVGNVIRVSIPAN